MARMDLIEITITRPTQAYDVEDGQVRAFTISPQDYDIPLAEKAAIQGGTVEDNLSIARSILSGEQGAPRNVVLLNAGAGAYVAGLAGSIGDGIKKAVEALDSGAARAKLEDIRVMSARLKQQFGTGAA